MPNIMFHYSPLPRDLLRAAVAAVVLILNQYLATSTFREEGGELTSKAQTRYTSLDTSHPADRLAERLLAA